MTIKKKSTERDGNSGGAPVDEITEQQVLAAELLICDNFKAAKKFGHEFRSDLREGLAEAKRVYAIALHGSPRSRYANKRRMQVLRNSISSALLDLGRNDVQALLMSLTPWPSADADSPEGVYEAYCMWKDGADAFMTKIKSLSLALAEMRDVVDLAFESQPKNSKEAEVRSETYAVAMAAGAFFSQVEHWGLPRGLWYKDLTPSPLATIIAEALKIVGIKATERGIAQLKLQPDPVFNHEVLVIPARPRGKRR
jgi:hypothetical protein